ncbi:MAG TPA: radical SAM protein [Microcoleaceae cyanobacterium]|jgi:hypothetical protein
MNTQFSPYQPPYTTLEKLRRYGAILQAALGAFRVTIGSKVFHQSETAFGASVEVTDRCNAGCHYCYVYNPDWDQKQRLQGYLELSPSEHRHQEAKVLQTLEALKRRGIVQVTVVGGETALAPKAVQRAAELFPIVWVVTNGAAKLPTLPRSASIFVSIDGPPDYHNRARDPLGFFAEHRYGELAGMSAAIVRNINHSERGAFAHITLTKPTVSRFPETVDWLVRDVKKLRGIVVSGAATKEKTDPIALTIADRQLIHQMINDAADRYGWELFPFNQPKVNEFLFTEPHIIYNAVHCTVARRVKSLDFNGDVVGKCVLRDETLCETCVCNITGLMRAAAQFDLATLQGIIRSSFG